MKPLLIVALCVTSFLVCAQDTKAKKEDQKDAAADVEPMYILDGVKLKKGEVSKINPDDIASMHVLKGDSAITKYGEAGRNGVVLIDSKKAEEKRRRHH
jgi:TonB-dependent SusC/RagA subfamily outer membrane receptor